MTALLTDETVDRAGEEFARDGAEDNLGSIAENKYAFIRGARFACSIYEARLAEDAKVRAGLEAELENIVRANWREWDPEVRDPQSFVDWAKSRASAALLAAKEIK